MTITKRGCLSCVALAATLACPGGVWGQARPRRDTSSVSPLLGLLGFARINVGAWALNHEHVFGEHLGVLVEATLVHVHGPPMHMWLTGGSVGARWHFAGLGSSAFVGVQAGYRYGWGRNAVTYTSGGVSRAVQDNALTAGQILVVANVGYRWVHASGFTVTGRLGAGYGAIIVQGSDATPESSDNARVTQEVLGFTPLAVDTELSVGYTF